MNGDLTSVIRDEIFKSIHLITDSKLRTANFTSFLTSIISYVDANDPFHYKVKYQGKDIDVYSVGGQTYNLGDNVIILYSNLNFNQTKFILASSARTNDSSTLLKSQIYYASYQSGVTQTAAAVNTAYAYTFDTVDRQYGIRLGRTPTSGTTSIIYFPNGGLYDFQVSLQLYNSGNGDETAIVWLKKGVVSGSTTANISNSSVYFDLHSQGSGKFKGYRTLNYLIDVNPDDVYEIAYAYSATSVQIISQAAGTTWPASSSILCNVNLIKPL